MANFKLGVGLAVVAAGLVFEGFAAPASAGEGGKTYVPPFVTYNQGFIEGELAANGQPLPMGRVWSKAEAVGIQQGIAAQQQANFAYQVQHQREIDLYSISACTREIQRLQKKIESSPNSRLRGYYEWKIRRDQNQIDAAKARQGLQ